MKAGEYIIREKEKRVTIYDRDGRRYDLGFTRFEDPDSGCWSLKERRELAAEGDPYHQAFVVARDELTERGLIAG